MGIMDIVPIKLRSGNGNGNPKNGLCLMQAVNWFSGAKRPSDRPDCASPALREIGIWLNDLAPTQADRDRLWPLVWLLLDSRDPEAEQQRIEHIIREVAHRIVAAALDSLGLCEHAAALRAASSMRDIEVEARAAAAVAVPRTPRMVAREMAGVAQSALTIARAAEVAQWAAWAAAEAQVEEIARMSAMAVSAAAMAVQKASAVETAGTVRMWVTAVVWNELLCIFTEAIALGKHGEPDPVYEPRVVELIRVCAPAKARLLGDRDEQLQAVLP